MTCEERPTRADIAPNVGDVAFARMAGTTKVLAIAREFEGVLLSTGFALLRPTPEVDPGYLVQWLRSVDFQSAKDKRAVGATQRAITNDAIEKLTIPWVPPEEQRRLSGVLDEADLLRKRWRARLAETSCLAPSVFAALVGNADSRKHGWAVTPLSTFLVFLTSGSRGWARYYADKGKPFLRIQNVGRNRMLRDEIIQVAPPDGAEADRTRVEPGDVLLSITADLGRTAVVPTDLRGAHINQHLALLRVKGIEPKYLSAFLACPMGQAQILRLNRQGVKAGLNFDDIRALRIVVPPASVQARYVEIEKEIELLEQAMHSGLGETDRLVESVTALAFSGGL